MNLLEPRTLNIHVRLNSTYSTAREMATIDALKRNATAFRSLIITTTANTIGGPALVVGQLQRYKSVTVRGTAKSVAF